MRPRCSHLCPTLRTNRRLRRGALKKSEESLLFPSCCREGVCVRKRNLASTRTVGLRAPSRHQAARKRRRRAVRGSAGRRWLAAAAIRGATGRETCGLGRREKLRAHKRSPDARASSDIAAVVRGAAACQGHGSITTTSIPNITPTVSTLRTPPGRPMIVEGQGRTLLRTARSWVPCTEGTRSTRGVPRDFTVECVAAARGASIVPGDVHPCHQFTEQHRSFTSETRVIVTVPTESRTLPPGMP